MHDSDITSPSHSLTYTRSHTNTLTQHFLPFTSHSQETAKLEKRTPAGFDAGPTTQMGNNKSRQTPSFTIDFFKIINATYDQFEGKKNHLKFMK